VGPFIILETLSKGKAYRLDLPKHYKIHDVISVVYLEPAPCPGSDPYGRPVLNEGVEPVYAHSDGDDEWEIHSLLRKRTIGRGKARKAQYLARWKGYGPEWDQWLDEAELENAQDLVKSFEETQMTKELVTKAAEEARKGAQGAKMYVR
jgi:hypothetical protein